MYLQGEIYLANLDPTQGQEQAGKRPILIVSGDSFNQNNSIVMICPITSKLKNLYGDIILKPNTKNGLESPSEILGCQIRTISTSRLTTKLGNISAEEIQRVLQGIGMLLKY